MSGKELFIRFTAHAFRKLLSIYVFSYFPFGFVGRIWDLIVSVPDHCLSFYFPVFILCVFKKPVVQKSFIQKSDHEDLWTETPKILSVFTINDV